MFPLIDLRFSEGLIGPHPLNEAIRAFKGADLSGKHMVWVYPIF